MVGRSVVKKSVGQDDPGADHLCDGDGEGHPGTDLTFFPWAQLAPHRDGHGLSTEVSLAVPPGSLGFWSDRLARSGVRLFSPGTRFGPRVLALSDPLGLRAALTESERPPERPLPPLGDTPDAREAQGEGGSGGGAAGRHPAGSVGAEPGVGRSRGVSG